MSSYERFLGAGQEVTLPYLGGLTVDALDRRLRVSEQVDLGWWTFEVHGRDARPIRPGVALGLGSRPIHRGHVIGDWIVTPPSQPHRLWLVAEQPPRFAAVIAREWTDGVLLFDTLDLEMGQESAARRAFDDRATWDGRGAPATLRGAYAIALAMDVAAQRRTTLRATEVTPYLSSIVSGGVEAASAAVRGIEAARVLEAASRNQPAADLQPTDLSSDSAVTARVQHSLETAGATTLEIRRAGDGSRVVRYRFLGDVFTCLIDSHTLQVLDAGICLEGHDRQLSLDSLPSVVREAVMRNDLVVTWND